jgi:thiol:disulfide interchange protein
MVLGVMLAVGCGQGPAQTGSPVGVRDGAASLSWESNWDTALKKARGTDQVVMVEFFAQWCVWCKRMQSGTFTDPKVVGLLSGRAVPLRLDAEREGKILASRFNVQGFPTIVFLDADEREIGRVPGYMDAGDFANTVRGWVQ